MAEVDKKPDSYLGASRPQAAALEKRTGVIARAIQSDASMDAAKHRPPAGGEVAAGTAAQRRFYQSNPDPIRAEAIEHAKKQNPLRRFQPR